MAASDTLKSYWDVTVSITEFKYHNIVYVVEGNDTYPFFIACLTDNGSCCSFASQLTVQNVSLEYSGTTFSFW